MVLFLVLDVPITNHSFNKRLSSVTEEALTIHKAHHSRLSADVSAALASDLGEENHTKLNVAVLSKLTPYLFSFSGTSGMVIDNTSLFMIYTTGQVKDETIISAGAKGSATQDITWSVIYVDKNGYLTDAIYSSQDKPYLAVKSTVQDSGVDLTLCTFYDLSSIYKKTKNAMILSKVGVVILAMISFVGAVAATLFLSRYTKRAKKNETGN